MRGAAAQVGRKGRNHHGGTRSVHVVRELRPALSHLGRDREGIEPDGGERAVLPHALRDRRADQLRGDLDLGQEEDRGPARCHDGRRDNGILRQAGAVPGAPSVHPTLPGHRPARNLPGEDGARCTGDPRMDRTRHDVPRRDVQLFGNPACPADAASRRDRRRLHRPRDGGEPDPCRVRGNAARDARPGARPSRPRVCPPRRGAT